MNVAGTFASMVAAGLAYPTRNACIGRAWAGASTRLECLGAVAAATTSPLAPTPPIETLPLCLRILPSRRCASVHPSPLAHPVRHQQAPVTTRALAPTVRWDSAKPIRIAPRDSVIAAPAVSCAGGIYTMAKNAKRTILASRCCAIAASARILEGRGTAITASHASPCHLLPANPGAPTIPVAGTFASTEAAGRASPTRNARTGRAEVRATTILDCLVRVAAGTLRSILTAPPNPLPLCPRSDDRHGDHALSRRSPLLVARPAEGRPETAPTEAAADITLNPRSTHRTETR
jgi:hypothetical protein